MAKCKFRHTSAFLSLIIVGLCIVALSACGSGGAGGPRIPVERGLVFLPLSTSHGLATGEITIAPGQSEEHGNVVVSCPAGGSACVIVVAADGTASYAKTGGVPSFMLADLTHELAGRTYQRDNPSAEDLLDHWNDPDLLRDAMGLSAVDGADIADRKSALKVLLEGAGGDPAGVGTLFRNVQGEDIQIIGERNGITYGRWTGGPAGNLNIEFDWRLALDIEQNVRIMIERAGKSWSWRLADEYPVRTIDAGSRIVLYRRPAIYLDHEQTTDGLIIFMEHYDEEGGRASGTPLGWDLSAIERDDFQPYLGAILLDDRRFGEVPARSNALQISVLAHEIGHVLGISQRLRRFDFYNALVNEQDFTFNGANAVEANGGEPVPYQWLNEDRRPVDPFSPDGTIDWSHLGPGNSIMSYRRSVAARFVPDELDFAFLADIGYEVLDAEAAGGPEIYGFGAWGDYSGWGAGVARTIDYEPDGSYVVVDDELRGSADAFGLAPPASLSDVHAAMQGSISWLGSLIGIDLGQTMLPPVFGNAELRIELSTLEGTAEFDDLMVSVDGKSSAFRAPQLEYAIAVTGNSFSDEDGHVQGAFFGPAHEEMAGVLDDRTDSVNLLAGFGGKR